MTKQLFDTITAPVKNKVYYFLLILNLVSNCAGIYLFEEWQHLIGMFLMSFIAAYVETVIYLLLKWTWLRRLYLIVITIINNILILVDYYMVFHYQTVLHQETIDILSETNATEIRNFFSTYLDFQTIFISIVALLLLNAIAYGLSILFSKVRLLVIPMVLSFCGLGVFGLGIYNYIVYRNGMSIPQYTAITRVASSCRTLNTRTSQISDLRKLAKSTRVSLKNPNPTDIVVVIGESFSTFHSSLYDYPLPTNPLLEKREKDGSLIVFDDAITLFHATLTAMISVFSLGEKNEEMEKYPLFPMCFKNAGYHTAMYDNQYFIGNNVTFLSDKKLSELMFDKRNNRPYNYDMDMVNDIKKTSSPALYVVHLWGQHFDYKLRYPTDFQVFTAKDYDPQKYSEDQREVLAHYDNATRYNDAVMDEIIRKYEDEDCILVYFSDHGEEIYDYRDYVGHCNADHADDIRYQIKVPFMVWASNTFREKRKDLWESIRGARHLPITTDDVSHFLLDVAGIECASFSARRSFANPQYDKGKRRMVMNSIDYDERVRDHTN